MDNLSKSKERLDKIGYGWLDDMRNHLESESKLFPNENIRNAVERRKKVEFAKLNPTELLQKHIEGMILSMLSSGTDWSKIEGHQDKIKEVFRGYNADEIRSVIRETEEDKKKELAKAATKDEAEKIILDKKHKYTPFYEALGAVKDENGNKYNLRGQYIVSQMKCLENNIDILEKNISSLEDTDNSIGYINKCIAEDNLLELVKSVADESGKYKLEQLAIPLACEYLRNVGVNLAKPDRHVIRFLNRFLLGYKPPHFGDMVSLKLMFYIRDNQKNIEMIDIDNIIWSFCAKGYGEVCGSNPKCEVCPVKDRCEYYNLSK